MTDAPGKVIFHVRIPDVQIGAAFTKPDTLPHRAQAR